MFLTREEEKSYDESSVLNINNRVKNTQLPLCLLKIC